MSGRQQEEYKAAMQLLKAKTESYSALTDVAANVLSFDDVTRIFDTLNMERHDIFARQWCLGNRIEFEGTDVNPVSKVIDFLKSRGLDDDADQVLERSRLPRFRGFRKTPDLVDLEVVEGNLVIRIVDFAVSRSPKHTINTKMQKYRPFLDIFQEEYVSLAVVVLNPVTLEVYREVEGHDWGLMDDRVDDPENDRIFAETERTKDKVKRLLSSDDKDKFEDWLAHKDRYGDGLYVKDVELDHRMDVETFCELAQRSQGWAEFTQGLDHEQRRFLEALLVDGENHEYRNKLTSLLGLRGTLNKEELVEELAFWEQELKERAKKYVPKHVPREPSKEEMDEAISKLEVKAADMFEALGRSKILSPIPVDFSNNDKGKIRSNLKHSRVKVLRDHLKSITKKDDLINAIMLLTEFAEAGDDDYEKFKTGEICYLSDGTMMAKEDYEKRLKTNHEQRMKLANESKISVEEKTELMREMEKGNLVGISMKKGEVIVVKPKNSKEVQRLFDMAGVGLKVKMEAAPVKETRVESLPFWDEEGLTKWSDEFDKEVVDFINDMVQIGDSRGSPDYVINPDLPQNRTSSGESSTESEGSSKSKLTKKEKFDSGVEFASRNYEVIYDNLLFVSHMANSGFRIIQSNNPNTFLITMPSESILKGDSSIPFVVVSWQGKGDIHHGFRTSNDLDYQTPFGTLHVTMGRRFQRSQLAGYVRAKNIYEVGKACMNNLFKSAGLTEMDEFEKSILFLFANNINIGTSSMLDNARYLVELVIADFSFCKEFIEDKMMVPTKNMLQLYMYKRLKTILPQLNISMKGVKTRSPMMNEEGEVDLKQSRIVAGFFPSFMFPGRIYQKPEQLIQEIQVLYFSIPKGLHGRFHNLLEINKTPIKIQQMIDENYQDMKFANSETPERRLEYNPFYMALISRIGEDSTVTGRTKIRDDILRKEHFNESPLLSKTLSSTRSTLIKAEVEAPIDKDGELYEMPDLEMKDEAKRDKLIALITEFDAKIMRSKTRNERKRLLKTMKMKTTEMLTGADEQTANRFVQDKIFVNQSQSRLEVRVQLRRSKIREDALNIMKNASGTSNHKFYTSGVVLTEMLKNHFIKGGNDRRSNKQLQEGKPLYYTVGQLSSEAVKQKEAWAFGVRPKRQRTQKDREIYVVTTWAKLALYTLEHTYKQICTAIPEEKISEAGDIKIMSLQKQVKEMYGWAAKKDKTGKSTRVWNFNLDMTKWAPHDNCLKFIWTIAASRIQTTEEKLQNIMTVLRLYEKEFHVDEEIIVKASRNKTRLGEMQEDKRAGSCVFDKATDGFKTNMVKIKHTWLQGQLNYISSYVHAGAMLFWEQLLKEEFGERVKVQINVHSDDNQMTIGLIVENEEDLPLIVKMWSFLEFCTINCCIEISIKKSFISKLIKLFVAQYNIAGEQVYLWVKPLMASVSGIPYTTLKDDISSVMSKVSEALSKGCPKEVASIAMKRNVDHILGVYGIREKDGRNKFASLLNVPEHSLPMCLGGCYVEDYTTLAMGGPRVVDQMIIMNTLRRYNATSVSAPDCVLTKDQEQTTRIMNLYMVLDHLSKDSTEEEDDTFSSNLNCFRAVKFLNRRNGPGSPFGKLSKEETEMRIKLMMLDHPSLSFQKPKAPEDIADYYFILYQNPSFKAALAGQSPDMLMMSKICNKKKGIFKFKNAGNIHDMDVAMSTKDKLEGAKNEAGVAEILTELMQSINSGLASAKYLWSKHIGTDPEFKVLWYTKENCIASTRIVRHNPEARKKPNFSNYSEILNPIPLILTYFFDESMFKRSGLRIPYPNMLLSDFDKLARIFPSEMMTLRWMAHGNPNAHSNFIDMMNKLSKEDKTAWTFKEKYAINATLERKMAATMERGWMKAEYSGEGIWEFTESDESLAKSIQEKLPDRMLKMARAFKSSTMKVLFAPPTSGTDISDISLSMRQVIESSGNRSTAYFLSMTQKQNARMALMKLSKSEIQRAQEYCLFLSNLYAILVKLHATDEQIMKAIKGSSAYGIRIENLKELFSQMPRYLQTRVTIPLYRCYPALFGELMRTLEPMSITWPIPEMGDEGTYMASIRGDTFRMTFSGSRTKVDNLTITMHPSTSNWDLTKAARMLLADLKFRDRFQTKHIRIAEYVRLIPKGANYKPLKTNVMYNTVKDIICKYDDRDADMIISGKMILDQDMTKGRRPFINPQITDGGKIIEYEEDGVQQKFRHKDYRNVKMHGLEQEEKLVCQDMDIMKNMNRPITTAILNDSINQLTVSEVASSLTSVGNVVQLIGSDESLLCFELLTQLLEGDYLKEANVNLEILDRVTKSGGDMSDFEVNKVVKRGDMETLFKAKELNWREISDRKDKIKIKFASAIIAVQDEYADLQDEDGGFSDYDRHLNFEMRVRQVDRVMQVTEGYTTQRMLEESGHDNMGEFDNTISSLLFMIATQMRNLDTEKFNRSVRNLKFEGRKNLGMLRDVEMACYYFGKNQVNTALNASQESWVDIEANYNTIKKMLTESKYTLSSITLGFANYIKRIYESYAQSMIETQRSKLLDWAQGARAKRTTRGPKSHSLSSKDKAVINLGQRADGYQNDPVKYRLVMEESKRYASGTETDSAASSSGAELTSSQEDMLKRMSKSIGGKQIPRRSRRAIVQAGRDKKNDPEIEAAQITFQDIEGLEEDDYGDLFGDM